MIQVLDNIILAPILGIGYSSIAIFIAAGSTQESTQRTGTAHLLEHVLGSQIDFGNILKAETQLEHVSFQLTQSSGETAENLKKIKTVLFDTSLDKRIFDSQKKRLELELMTSYQSDRFQSVYRELFGESSGQFRGWSGSLADVKALTFDEIRDHRENNFSPNKSVIVISGDFDVQMVLDTISELSLQTPLSFTSPDIPNIERKIVWQTQMDEIVASVDIFIPASPLTDLEGRVRDTILKNCLTGGNQSLLDKLLYKEIASAYFIESEVMHWTNGGVIALGYSTRPEKAEETADKVNEIMANFHQNITKEVFNSARDLSLIEHTKITRGPEYAACWLAENLLLTGKISTFEEQEKLLKSRTFEEILSRSGQVAQLETVVIRQQ